MHLASLLTFLTCTLVFSCNSQKRATDPGPAQKAGAAIDESAADAKDSTEKAGKKVGAAAEKAGDKIKEKTSDH